MNQDVKTQFAAREDTKIAYRVYGSGAKDLIIVPGIISHVEYAHELPGYNDFIQQLTPHFRIIVFDKRGNGLSQKLADSAPTLEERMDDIRLVLDAVGSERATVMGVSEGGSLSALFAAMYPERTEKLILFGAFAHTPGLGKLKRLPNFSTGLLKKFMVWKAVKNVIKTWGNGEFVRKVLPSRMLINNELRQKFKQFELACLM